MNIPNFREKGTNLPNLPEETLYNVVSWSEDSKDYKLSRIHEDWISYGYKLKNGVIIQPKQ